MLIGGATGTGKSTVATEVAWRLGITRVTSTDFVRQTMRAFFSRRVHAVDPLLELRGGRGAPRAGRRPSTPPSPGFLEQTRNVLVGVRAALERALQEGWSMVLEGVHLVPGLIPPPIEGALVVQCVLAIEDEDEHRTHFAVRDAGIRRRPLGRQVHPRLPRDPADPGRRSSPAPERADVPVIENDDVEEAIGGVMELVLDGRRDAGGEVVTQSAEHEHADPDRGGGGGTASARPTRARPSARRSPAPAGSGAATRRARTRPRSSGMTHALAGSRSTATS